TIVRSVGTPPVASCCSRMNCTRLAVARSSRWYSSRSRVRAFASDRPLSSRDAAPIFWPSSNGRPTPSPFQNGTAPGTPGAGGTRPGAGGVLPRPRGGAAERDLRAARASLALPPAGPAPPPPAVVEEAAKQPAVRDRSGMGAREPACAVARTDAPAGAVPDDP